MIIQIIGLPGSGKTELAKALKERINAIHLNADEVRATVNSDLGFLPDDRIEQARRMGEMARLISKQGVAPVIVDFVCPTDLTRAAFGTPDVLVWVDRIKQGRFEDTNKMFVPPEEYDFRVPTQNAELWSLRIADEIQEHVWDNRKPTAQMLGRWQPWHEGHQTLFEEIVKKTGQVNIQVRDVQGVGDNPFDFETVKKNIEQALQPYKNRIQVTLVPNITNICYGRGVGYKIEEIVLPENIQKISATDIRKKMREEGKL